MQCKQEATKVLIHGWEEGFIIGRRERIARGLGGSLQQPWLPLWAEQWERQIGKGQGCLSWKQCEQWRKGETLWVVEKEKKKTTPGCLNSLVFEQLGGQRWL